MQRSPFAVYRQMSSPRQVVLLRRASQSLPCARSAAMPFTVLVQILPVGHRRMLAKDSPLVSLQRASSRGAPTMPSSRGI